MQSSVPELIDLSKESESTVESYGPDARKPGQGVYRARLFEAGRRAAREFLDRWNWEDYLRECSGVTRPG